MGWVPVLFQPSPLGVAAEGWKMVVFGHLAASLRRLMLGLAVGGGLGVYRT